MTQLSLLVLAAGMGSRYGALKQLDAAGPQGETLLDYSVYDAVKAGFSEVIFVIRQEMEEIFRQKISNRYEKTFPELTIKYAFQKLDDLPQGFSFLDQRSKPWGTGHALLAARNLIKNPFAVINADDYYGASGYQTLAPFLATTQAGSCAIIAYRLKNTLSDYGAVSRGICQGTDFLISITERTALCKKDGNITAEEKNELLSFTGEELVSLNFWALTPDIFLHLEKLFTEFLESLDEKNQATAEFYLPSAISDCIKTQKASVRLLLTDDAWFGLTYSADLPRVKSALSDMVSEKKYPAPLFYS